MKQSQFFVVVTATLALLSCGKAPPGAGYGQGSGGPVQQVSQVGKSFTLMAVQSSFGAAAAAVPTNSMTITFTSNTQVKGSFACYMGNTFIATDQFLATATWNLNTVTFSGVQSSDNSCQPNHFFNFQSTMTYQFTNNELTLTAFSGWPSAIFSLQQ